MGPPPLAAADDAATRPPALSQASTAPSADASSTASGPPSSPAPASSIAGIGLSAEAAAVAAAAAAAASGNGTAAPAVPAPVPAVESSKGSKRQHKRMELLEAKLQVFMDHEDQRVKELTESVLYELLPAALHVMLPSCEDPLTELDPERCRAVAGAALAASALMNAPPGFLEFLLCIPWRQLPQLYPNTAPAGQGPSASKPHHQQPEQQKQEQEQQFQQPAQQDLLAESAADEAERRLLVNLPLHPKLVRPVLQFMYKPQHEDSVPPVLRPEKKKQPTKQQQQAQQPAGQQQAPQPSPAADCTADDNLLAVAEALLDGATPLHCAALRGNPAQVDHLLYCGADPTRKTAVGDLPLQLVPRCGGYSQATRMCTCLGPSEQAVWECRSRIARTLIANKCLTAFRVGFLQYLSLLWLCLLAFLGLNWGAKAAMVRLLTHMQRREEQQAEEARLRTTAALQAMRHEANLGQAHLTLAKQQIGSRQRHQHSSSGGSEGPWAAAAGHVRGASTGSSAASTAAANGAVPGGGGLEGLFGQLGYDAGAEVAAAAPRPVATAAGANDAAVTAAAAGVQEPQAPGTPSASEEAAAGYSTAGKARRTGSGSLRWSAPAGEIRPELSEQPSAGSSSSDSSSSSSYIGQQVDSRGFGSTQGDGRNSELNSGRAAAGAADAHALEHAQRQQLLQELLLAANTCAADASPTVAAAAALAVDAEHAWHDPAGSFPLATHAQTFSDNAFKCFVRAVHTLQRLNLQEDCTPLAVFRADKGDAVGATSGAAPVTDGNNSTAAAAAAAAATAATGSAGVGGTAAAHAKLKQLQAAAVAAGVADPQLAAAITLETVAGSSPRSSSTGGAALNSTGPTFALGGADAGLVAQQDQQQHLFVLEDEQANLYCCWAESVLLKHNACACAGCTALAVHAIRMAHIAVVRLFNRVHKQRMRLPLRWRAVGQALSRIVYVHIALMCRTEAAVSPSKASVWRAQQCLSEWDQLVAAGLAGGPDQQEAAAALTAGNTVEGVVEVLRLWTKTAESDLLIAEALLGIRLSSLTTLDEALTAAFVTPVPPVRSCLWGGGAAAAVPGSSSTSCLPVLVRPVSAALLNELQSARGLAPCPSPTVKQLAAQVADATAAELSAGARLKELLAGRIPPSTQEGVAALAAAITAAEPFSSLTADVEAAKDLHQQSCVRAEIAAQLQTVVEQVARLTSRVSIAPGGSGSSGGGAAPGDAGSSGGSNAGRGSSSGGGDGVLGLPLQGFSMPDWQQYVAMLEAAVEPAKDANVGVTRARKLIKELQAQMAAAEAAAGLNACMSRRPCGSNALKSAISKAEAAAASVSTTATTTTGSSAGAGSSSGGAAAAGASSGGAGAASSSCVFSEVLVVRLQAAKKRLDVERAAEALHKASVSYKSVAELPKLETAVLNARKVGAEELAPDEYKAASELRARLTSALRIKQQLESALKGLAATSMGTGPRGRQLEQLAEPVEAAIREAARCEELLPGEAARASELLEAWRTSSACEAKLSRALRDGCSAATLSRIISEAAAAGVKVTSAKRILKLQQVLEAAVATANESASTAAAGAGHCQLVAKLEAAETGGVAPSVLQPARQLLRKLLAVEARQALEAALKPHSDWSFNTRISTLRAALDKAEEALGCSMQELEQQQQQQDGQQDSQQGEDVPQQQDQQQKAATDAATAADASEQGKLQRRRSIASATCSISTLASSGGGKSASQQQQQQQQQQLTRTDSMASSEACSEASSLAPSSTTGGGGSTTGHVQHGSRQGSGSGSAVDPEVMSVLQELSLRAWQLLQQDQQQLEERETERLEQERERRERERNERQRAAAERAERGKAEREKAAQERKAARAKAAAERAKAFTVVFGTSAGSMASYSSVTGSQAGSGRSGSSGKQQRDVSRHSMDSTGASADADMASLTSPRTSKGGSNAANGAGSVAQGQGQAGSGGQTRWGSNKQQQEQRKGVGSAGKDSKARTVAAVVRSSSPAAAAAAPAASSEAAASAADADGMPPLVAVAHTRCDSYEILGDEHSKLGLDMLALLESPEDTSAPSSTTAATQQQQQQQQHLLRPSRSVDAPCGAASLQQQQAQLVQGSSSAAGDGQQQCAEATGSGQQGGSHPATPKLNLVDLGGASWGLDAEGLVPLNQPVRPASAGGCITSLSPGSAAAARATAAMDMVRQSLDLQAGAAGSGQPNIWRSPLGLGIEGPSALPPLAPRGQQLPLRHAASQGGRHVTDEGADSLLDARQQQQQLSGLQGANSYDPVTSPAGKISPVGTAVTTLGSGHVPEPAFLHRQGVIGSGGMGLSSPRSYPQLQQAHPSLLQHQLAAHSRSIGGSSLLSSFVDGSAAQTAAAISSMGGGDEHHWLMQQQQHLGGSSASGLLGAAAIMQHGVSCFSSMPQSTLAVSDALQMQFEQQLLQQQLQQYHQQQGLGQGVFTGGDLSGGLGGGLLSAPLSAPLAAPVSSGLAVGASAGPLGSQGGGVGALSSSFAFGAPYSSSFSPAPMRGSSSLGGAGSSAPGAADGFSARDGTAVAGSGDDDSGQTGLRGSGCLASTSRPELLLPDDLNFSPPSAGPARWLQE